MEYLDSFIGESTHMKQRETFHVSIYLVFSNLFSDKITKNTKAV